MSSSSGSLIEASSEALFQVKLLSALRSGDPASIHPFLAEVGRRKASSDEYKEEPDLAAVTIHLGIRCASYETLVLLLSHRSVSPNAIHPPGSGTTPLHLAASLGRVDVVKLLLEQDSIDDTLRDSDARSVLDVATKDAKDAILDDRASLASRYLELLSAYVSSTATDVPPTALLSLLSSPRARNLDLSALDAASGTTLLHEAARRSDFRLVELAVRAGADVFVRDRKGRGVTEVSSGKNGGKSAERVRVFLRQFTNRDTTLMDPSSSEPPAMQGYLNKYVNVAKGYGARWFVLKDGVLSYYRNREDENLACRGSISMKSVKLKLHNADRLRFDIHTSTSRSSSTSPANSTATNTQKWYIRANHPVELARWTQAIERSIKWYSTQEKSDAVSVRSHEGTSSRSLGLDTASIYSGNRLGSTRRSPKHLSRPGTANTSISVNGTGSRNSPIETGGSTADESGAEMGFSTSRNNGRVQVGPAMKAPLDTDAQSVESYESSDKDNEPESKPPHETTFLLQQNSLQSQLQLTSQLLSTLSLPPASTAPRMVEVKTSLASSLDLLQSMFTEYTKMASEREIWWKKQLAIEKERERVWETSLAGVVGESEGLERELRKLRAERLGRRKADRQSRLITGVSIDLTPKGNITEDKEKRDLGSSELGAIPGMTESETLRARTLKPNRKLPTTPPLSVSTSSLPASSPTSSHFAVDHASPTTPQPLSSAPKFPPPHPTYIDLPPSRQALPAFPVPEPVAPSFPVPQPAPTPTIEEPPQYVPADSGTSLSLASDEDNSDEEEFFDALDSGTISKNLETSALTTRPSLSPPDTLNMKQYEPYNHIRSRLPIGSDNRPPVSLWAVLKGSIGKDLTKISFPVFFNEPTSMLQRMAEDMEYTECLDAAAQQSDPHKRIAFVAAFAMSNYSSTIGRIAKPFNPMLSETFEYCRLDKKYRYFSEQVSHHPPISACWSESPMWNYYGEVDAQNKFMGKSFEIRPTGVAHADLKLSADMVPDGLKYPMDSGYDGKSDSDKYIEHYSWKKVTTNVSGFILGSPTIDHYGTMTVTNHRTGDKCVLTFKPRGWRGKFGEITGAVMDKRDRITWEIAGRWSSQLVARRAGTGVGDLLPDEPLPDSSTSPSASMQAPKYLLLWKNTVKPPAPFNLTPYAITLNDCPDDLKVQLPPTDCRLRPDQRAFELGRYERANELKSLQEDFQRATRKKRETGALPPHKPRWFAPTVEKDTGERVWAPRRIDDTVEYWVEREKVWKDEGKGKWKEVEDIFIKDHY